MPSTVAPYAAALAMASCAVAAPLRSVGKAVTQRTARGQNAPINRWYNPVFPAAPVAVRAASCPAGYAKLSEYECKSMAVDTGNSFGRVDAWPYYVPGCFNHGNIYYYNTHPTGAATNSNDNAGELWCRRAPASAPPSASEWPSTMFANSHIVYTFASPEDYVYPEYSTGSRLWGKGTSAVRAMVFAAIADIEAKTSIRFRARTPEEAAATTGTKYIKIGSFAPDHCTAHGLQSNGVAMVNLGANKNSWCGLQRGVVQQEMLHALGLGHEFQRFDRDQFVTFRNPDAGNFKRNPVDDTLGLPMDFASVMQYQFRINGYEPNAAGLARLAEQGLSRAEVGAATELSALDAEKLNRMYFNPEAVAGEYTALFGVFRFVVAQLNPGSSAPVFEVRSVFGSWTLTPLSNTATNLFADGRQTFAVGTSCPWYNAGYTTVDIVFGARGAVKSLEGQGFWSLTRL